MARDLTVGALAEIGAAVLRPALFYEGVFVGGTLRLWTGVGEIAWNGQTWFGAGAMLGMSKITETAGIVAQSVTLSLSGMDSSIIALVHVNARHGLAGTMWLGFLDADGAVIADPYKTFSGRLDVPEIVDQGTECNVSVTYESRLVRLLIALERRWTHEDQQIEYPGDLGFQYVASLQDQRPEW